MKKNVFVTDMLIGVTSRLVFLTAFFLLGSQGEYTMSKGRSAPVLRRALYEHVGFRTLLVLISSVLIRIDY